MPILRAGEYGLVRTDTEGKQHMVQCVPCAPEFLKHRAHTHLVPIVRQVRPVRPVRHSLLPPCALRNVLCQPTEHTALCHRNSKAHGTHCTMCCLPSEASGEGGSVQVRTSPYSLARTLCIAQCALPAAGNTLCFLVNAMHMEHGGNLTFPPVYPPFAPRVVERPAARNAASLS